MNIFKSKNIEFYNITQLQVEYLKYAGVYCIILMFEQD